MNTHTRHTSIHAATHHIAPLRVKSLRHVSYRTSARHIISPNVISRRYVSYRVADRHIAPPIVISRRQAQHRAAKSHSVLQYRGVVRQTKRFRVVPHQLTSQHRTMCYTDRSTLCYIAPDSV